MNLKKHCFDVIASKTNNGIRKVPIADKVYDFYKKWYNVRNKYLLHTVNGKNLYIEITMILTGNQLWNL